MVRGERKRTRICVLFTDGPHGTLLIRDGRRDVGLINKPPELHGRYRAYTLAGEPLPGEHQIRMAAALACAHQSDGGDPKTAKTLVDFSGHAAPAGWSCDSDTVIAAMDAEAKLISTWR